jgi:serine O-acetyltransferase
LIDAMLFHRVGAWSLRRGVPIVPRACEAVIFLVFSSVVPSQTEIGRNTRLGYRGIGVVIHPRAVIGSNVMVGPQVTIGGRSKIFDVPVIEDDVYIGAGARILGAVRVGRGSVVGANAVVLHSVPPRTVVAGVPAKVIRTDIEVADYASLPTDMG